MPQDYPWNAADAYHSIRRIAHPTEFSHVSERGLAWGIGLAQEYRAELLLLHIIPPPTPLFELEPANKIEAEIALSLLLGKVKAANVEARAFLLYGANSVESQIVRAARLERVDLIVIGTRGRTGVSRLLGRSLASRVIPRAHCPVLVVRGQ
jgi:universal stress protein A